MYSGSCRLSCRVKEQLGVVDWGLLLTVETVGRQLVLRRWNNWVSHWKLLGRVGNGRSQHHLLTWELSLRIEHVVISDMVVGIMRWLYRFIKEGRLYEQALPLDLLLMRNILIQLQQGNFRRFIFMQGLWVFLDFLILLLQYIFRSWFLGLKSHIALKTSHHWSSGIYVVFIFRRRLGLFNMLLLSYIVRRTIWRDVLIREDLRRSDLLFVFLWRWLHTLSRSLRTSIVVFMSSSSW